MSLHSALAYSLHVLPRLFTRCTNSYFAAAYPVSTQRTIFAAPIPAQPGSALESADRLTELTALTDISTHAWYEAAFSPEAGYYVLSYRGPNVPWQSIRKVGETPDGESDFYVFLLGLGALRWY